MSTKSKGLLSSLTIWGGLMAVIPQAVELLEIVQGSGVLPPEAAAIVSIVGAVLAMFGRVRATTTIKGLI